MYKHELYDLSMNRLVDMREAESASISTDCLRKLASFLCEQFKETQAHPKIAIVAPKDLSFGIARMYEVFTEDEDHTLESCHISCCRRCLGLARPPR